MRGIFFRTFALEMGIMSFPPELLLKSGFYKK